MKNKVTYTRSDVEHRYKTLMRELPARKSFAVSFLHDGKYRDLVSLLDTNLVEMRDQIERVETAKKFISGLR